MAEPIDAVDAPGFIYTFYSYKGGVGRSMAVANVGAVMAMEGKRVLLVDWDLEAPGLEAYFRRSARLVGDPARTPGIVDLLEARANNEPLAWRDCLLKAQFFGHSLDIISAGRKNDSYRQRVQQLDWKELFERHRIGNYINELREEWRAPSAYDVILIDSRTGITDIGDICTVLLPDVLVLMFVANHQNVDGIKDVLARVLRSRGRLPVNRSKLLSVPVPARDERDREYDRSIEWQNIFEQEFGDLYREWLPGGAERVTAGDALNKLYIPYVAKWSFGDRVPVIEHARERSDPSSLGAAYTRLASLLMHRLDWKKAIEARASASELAGTRAEVAKLRDAVVHSDLAAWRLRIAAASAVVVLTAAAIAGWWWIQRRNAEIQLTNKINEQVRKSVITDPLTASLLLRELPGQEDPGGLRQIAEALARAPLPSLTWKEPQIATSLSYSPDDKHVVMLMPDGVVEIRALPEWRTVGRVPSTASSRPLSASFSDNDTVVILRPGAAETWSVQGERKGQGTPVPSPLPLDRCAGVRAQELTKVKLTGENLGLRVPDDLRRGRDGLLVVYSYTPRTLGLLQPPLPLPLPVPQPANALGLVVTSTGGVALFDANTGRCRDVFADPGWVVGGLGADSASAVAVLQRADLPVDSYGVELFEAGPESGAIVRLPTLVAPPGSIVTGVKLSGDRQHIIVSFTSLGVGMSARLDRSKQEPVWQPASDLAGTLLGISKSGQYVATAPGSLNSPVILKSETHEWALDAWSGSQAGSAAIAFNHAETELVVASNDGRLSVWELSALPTEPPANTRWDALITRLAKPKACLDENQRNALLGEDWSTAGKNADACRRDQQLPGSVPE